MTTTPTCSGRILWRLVRAAAGVVAAISLAGGCNTTSRTVATVGGGTSPVASDVVGAWRVRTREHVDLWLHGFALLHEDSSLVPYFRPRYREDVIVERSHRGASALLDSSAAELRARVMANPGLVSAQFVALYWDSWAELRQAAATFLRVDGDARRAGSSRDARAVSTFGAYFATAADRSWLRLFLESLEDEQQVFFSAFWRDEQRRLAPAFDRAESLWRDTYRARFSRFLANTRQLDGEIVPALALAGEGRALSLGNRSNVVAVGFPAQESDGEALLIVFVHEIVGGTVNLVVADNTTPAERRSGTADKYASLAAVRGGALLLQRTAPELVDAYQRYYLGLARVEFASGNSERIFAETFPLPDALRDALARQIDIILAGI